MHRIITPSNSTPRNYKYEQERKLGNFFSYVCNSKKSKEMFTPTLNGIPASVRCVSSMIVVLNAKFAQLHAAHANKKDNKKRRSVPFLLVKTH